METPRPTSNGGPANPSTPKLLSSKASVASMQSTMSKRRHSPFPASLRKASAPTHTAVSHIFAQPKIAAGEGAEALAKLQRRVAAAATEEEKELKENSSLDSTQVTRGGPTVLSQEPLPSLQPSPLGPTPESGPQASASVGGSKQRATSMGWLSLRGSGQSAPNSNYDDSSAASSSGSSSRRQPTMDSMTSSVETIRPSHVTRTPKLRSVTVGNPVGGGGADFDLTSPVREQASPSLTNVVPLAESPMREEQQAPDRPPQPTSTPLAHIPPISIPATNPSPIAPSSSASVSPVPSPARSSKWFASVRRSSSTRVPNSATTFATTSSPSTVKPPPVSSSVSSPSASQRPGIPRFTPPSTPEPRERAPSVSAASETQSAAAPMSAAGEAAASPSSSRKGASDPGPSAAVPTDTAKQDSANKDVVVDRTPEPTKSPQPTTTSSPATPAPMSRGWFGGSRLSSSTSNSRSPSPLRTAAAAPTKGKEKAVVAPNPGLENLNSPTAPTMQVPQSSSTPTSNNPPPQTDKITPASPIKSLSLNEASPMAIPSKPDASASASTSARATPVFRGWFGGSRTSLAGTNSTAPSLKGKESDSGLLTPPPGLIPDSTITAPQPTVNSLIKDDQSTSAPLPSVSQQVTTVAVTQDPVLSEDSTVPPESATSTLVVASTGVPSTINSSDSTSVTVDASSIKTNASTAAPSTVGPSSISTSRYIFGLPLLSRKSKMDQVKEGFAQSPSGKTSEASDSTLRNSPDGQDTEGPSDGISTSEVSRTPRSSTTAPSVALPRPPGNSINAEAPANSGTPPAIIGDSNLEKGLISNSPTPASKSLKAIPPPILSSSPQTRSRPGESRSSAGGGDPLPRDGDDKNAGKDTSATTGGLVLPQIGTETAPIEQSSAGASGGSGTSDSASWWNYFGIGGGPTAFPATVRVVPTPATVEPPPQSAEQATQDADSSTVPMTITSSAPLPSAEATLLSTETIIPLPPSVPRGNGETEEKVPPTSVDSAAEPAPSVTSGKASSTGWMGPLWAWAGYPAELQAASQGGNEGEGGVPAKTEAELVKEEALRNDALSSAASTSTPQSSSAPEASPSDSNIPNEVNSTIPSSSDSIATPNPVVVHAPAKSWMSFFSSRNNLAVKRITDGAETQSYDSSGMEVMDIPEELDNSNVTLVDKTSGVASSSSSTKAPRSRTTSAERGRTGDPSSKDKDKVPAPPLTNSDTIKKKVTNNNSPPSSSRASPRGGSPAPSKSGGTGKKSNFVLPSFGDTFYTLPRAAPIPRPPPLKRSASQKTLTRRTAGLTKKTINFVSSWLAPATSPPKPAPSIEERKPSEDMIQYMEERRERLAKTWGMKTSGSVPPSPSSSSFATVSTSPPPGSTLTVATGSGSEQSVSANSTIGLLDHSIPVGRIAPKGHHHLVNGAFNQPSPLSVAKNIGKELPRVWDVLDHEHGTLANQLSGAKRVVVVGIHGWFPGAIIRTVLGEPTGTSSKLASMMVASVERYTEQHGLALEKLTSINLEGEGTIARRVAKLYQDLLDHPEWVEDLHQADVIFVATHSQGSIVSTQLIATLIADGHIRTESNREAVLRAAENSQTIPPSHPTRCLCLCLCGIHLGPLLYLNASSLTQPYFTYFETAAARELFEFQDTSSEVSQRYVKALGSALDDGVKFLYIASLDDQVVPIYSGTFMTASHPLIMRALYIDADAYRQVIATMPASDFLSNLIVLLLRIRNAGLDDSGLITHLSEGTAGSLSGVGHSTPYGNSGCYDLAVRYLFETSGVLGNEKPELRVDPFQARATRNDYEIPWALRGVISDPAILSLFASEIAELRQAFDEWSPKTTLLRELRRKLEPIQSLRILPPSPLALHSHNDEDEKKPAMSRL
ncbi:hypothetical protein FRC01_001704 [Tulasnella sp. 417]|nr:hypothetical protein FRC01_001704 [Tulasnella sp. 417]